MLALAMLGVACGAGAQAPTDVRIDIKGAGQRIRIHCEALVPSGGASSVSPQADNVLANDLDWSAAFDVTRSATGGQPPDGAQALVSGTLSLSGNQLRLQGQVRDLPGRRPILSREYRGGPNDWRDLCHRFADDIVLQFTGEPGISRTKIAYVAQKGRDKELYVMDLDGANRVALTADHSIASSPAFSHDGSLVLFTSYRGNAGPRVFVTRVTGGKPYLVSGRPGLNTSASYSPDGREIVCSLSMDGNAEIYILDARGGSPHRLTTQRAIDTSPAWAPTGRELAFTSDRGGAPQVYLMDHEGGNVRRLTYEVGYTDSPVWSPKGDRLAFVARTGSGFDIYTCRADGSDTRLVVSGASNENPHWSPDGRHIVYASNREGTFGLFVNDLDGRPSRRLDTGGMTATSPAWSPRPEAGGSTLFDRSGSSPGSSGGRP
jgi:TolB protein